MANGVVQKEVCVQWYQLLAGLKCQEFSGRYKKNLLGWHQKIWNY